MNSSKKEIPTIFYLAAVVIVLGGIIYSAQIVTQFLMAVFIAVIASKPVGYLERKGAPSGVAVAAVLLLIVLITSSIGGVIGSSVARFTANLDEYDAKVTSGIDNIFQFLSSFGIQVSTEGILNTIDPGVIMNFTAKLLNGLGALMGNMAMILLIVAFMLGEKSSYAKKLKAIYNKPDFSMNRITSAMTQINQYLAIKTITSLCTGLIIGLLLWAIGVDFPFMWGLIAFIMNYIPSIGSFIAAIPALFMAFINFGAPGLLWTGGIYLLVNVSIGNIIEPRVMGKGLGLSTLVVLLSLIFWGWILGTIGMFLSIPLTLAAKIAFESQESTKWIAILLGSERDAEAVIESKAVK